MYRGVLLSGPSIAMVRNLLFRLVKLYGSSVPIL